MGTLRSLSLSNNQVADLAPLAGTNHMEALFLGDNYIEEVSALEGCTKLTRLSLSYNKVSSISPLSNLTNLTELYLSHNQITDVSPLLENNGLGVGDTVRVTDNPFDCTTNKHVIDELVARGVEVHHSCEF